MAVGNPKLNSQTISLVMGWLMTLANAYIHTGLGLLIRYDPEPYLPSIDDRTEFPY